MAHGAKCTVKRQGGCNVCRRIRALLQIHARQCKRDVCAVPKCRMFKAQLAKTQLVSKLECHELDNLTPSELERYRDANGMSLMCSAAAVGSAEVLRELVRRGASVDTTGTPSGLRPVACGVLHGHVEVVAAAAQMGADLTRRLADPGLTGGHDQTLLQMAVVRGYLGVVKCLIQLGADVEAACQPRGNRPLHLAAVNGFPSVITALASARADVSATSDFGRTPGAMPPPPPAATATHRHHAPPSVSLAAMFGRPETILALAAAGADVTTPVPHGPYNTPHTPLAVAFLAPGLPDKRRFATILRLILLGAPPLGSDLTRGTSAPKMRHDLWAWQHDALLRHKTFHYTFLFGVTAHPTTSSELRDVKRVDLQMLGDATISPVTSRNQPVHLVNALGARVVVEASSTVTTDRMEVSGAPRHFPFRLAPVPLFRPPAHSHTPAPLPQLVTTTTTTTNPFLPMLCGKHEVLWHIAGYADVLMGKEVSRARALRTALNVFRGN